jgi:hypothetical protein
MLIVTDELHPAKAIRRFDVFAEYKKLEQMDKGMPEGEAKGYGLWVAKVVASRKFGSKVDDGGGQTGSKQYPESKWRTLDGDEQTDDLFDIEIMHRMHPDFYAKVFAPAIKQAFDDGKKYEDIRDSIREDWKPVKRKR